MIGFLQFFIRKQNIYLSRFLVKTCFNRQQKLVILSPSLSHTHTLSLSLSYTLFLSLSLSLSFRSFKRQREREKERERERKKERERERKKERERERKREREKERKRERERVYKIQKQASSSSFSFPTYLPTYLPRYYIFISIMSFHLYTYLPLYLHHFQTTSHDTIVDPRYLCTYVRVAYKAIHSKKLSCIILPLLCRCTMKSVTRKNCQMSIKVAQK